MRSRKRSVQGTGPDAPWWVEVDAPVVCPGDVLLRIRADADIDASAENVQRYALISGDTLPFAQVLDTLRPTSTPAAADRVSVVFA